MPVRIAGFAAQSNQTLHFHSIQTGEAPRKISGLRVVQGGLSTVGEAYPFTLVDSQTGHPQAIRLKDSWSDESNGQLIYTFCLLDSAMREKLILVPKAQKSYVGSIGNIFQICSCVAVGGYTNAEVVSFGFPRATGDDFLPALQAAWKRYGSFEVREKAPYGFDDKLKDGGVDIIAWRRFPDGHAGTFLMIVQVASGLDWKDKPVTDDVKSLKKWFQGNSFEHFTPAICIPFPLWFDLSEPTHGRTGGKVNFNNGVLTRFEFREAKFGVIFDRGRIAHCCAAALKVPAEQRLPIDGLDRLGEVSSWVSGVMQHLSEKRAVT